MRDALSNHIELTRSEPGCISFEVQEDPAHSGRFSVSEVFVDQLAFDAHQARTRDSEWFKVTQGIDRHYVIAAATDRQG